MERPKPKTELVIDVIFHTFISIRAATADARAWIEQEAPAFGRLYPPDMTLRGEHHLFVGAEYDIEEVAAYLNSYNSPQARAQ